MSASKAPKPLSSAMDPSLYELCRVLQSSGDDLEVRCARAIIWFQAGPGQHVRFIIICAKANTGARAQLPARALGVGGGGQHSDQQATVVAHGPFLSPALWHDLLKWADKPNTKLRVSWRRDSQLLLLVQTKIEAAGDAQQPNAVAAARGSASWAPRSVLSALAELAQKCSERVFGLDPMLL
jgi:hypothetical protein